MKNWWRKAYPRVVLWMALSPEYETPARQNEWYYDPPEWGRDLRYVFARSAQRAKVLAIRAWRREGRGNFVTDFFDENPMKISVQRPVLTPPPLHGDPAVSSTSEPQ